MRKRVIWIIVMALVSAYGLLSWVQYEYYGRVLELRTEGIRNQMKEAMGEVAEELQVRELIRYLNKGSVVRRTALRTASSSRPLSLRSISGRAPSSIPRSSSGLWIGRIST